MQQQRSAGMPAVTAAQDSRDLNKYLSISMGGESYGIGVLRIKEILEYTEPTPVPMMPPFIRGAINLRGRGVPVVDLSRRFGRGETALSRRTCIVIVEAPPIGGVAFDVGLQVDAVNEVVDIEPSAIEPAPNFGGRVRTDFLSGMGKVKERFIMLLNVDRILSLEDLQALGGVAEESRMEETQ